MGIFDWLFGKEKQEDKEIGAIFKLFDIIISLDKKEGNEEIKILAAETFFVLKEYGVDVNSSNKYIQLSKKISQNQLIEILTKIDSNKVINVIFPKLIILVGASGTVNQKKIDFLEMIGNTFVDSGTMPKEILDSFIRKVNKIKKDSNNKISDETNRNKDDIKYDMVAYIHLLKKMSSFGITNEKGREYFKDNYQKLLMHAHSFNDTPDETGKKYLFLADNISEDELIKILRKLGEGEFVDVSGTSGDDLFKLLVGMSVTGENVTKDSIALLQFLAKHTKLSESNIKFLKQASEMSL
tara:strand:+ start:311 stop:1201 length:891 start_codon:yes stop_codon:yes gene_type:complete